MIPSTVELYSAFPAKIVVFSRIYHYTPRASFAGRVMVVRPRYGREALRNAIEAHGGGRVCIIDGSADIAAATFGREELACAQAAKVKAVVVLGPLSDVAYVKSASIAIMASGATPAQLPSEGGDAALKIIRTDAGTVTDQHLVIADEDGVVAIESDIFEQRYIVNRPSS